MKPETKAEIITTARAILRGAAIIATHLAAEVERKHEMRQRETEISNQERSRLIQDIADEVTSRIERRR